MYNNIIEAEYLKDYVRPVTEEDRNKLRQPTSDR